MEPERISPNDVHERLESGEALLVCAYSDEETCKKMNLQGSISLIEFESNLSSLSKEKEIVFYCAWNGEATAAGQAAKYLELGYQNAKALVGGVDAWRSAGYPTIGQN